MTFLESIIAAVIASVIGLFVWLFKRNQMKLDEFDDRLDKALEEPQIRMIIDDKLEPLRLQSAEISSRFSRIESKLDRMYEVILQQRDNDNKKNT